MNKAELIAAIQSLLPAEFVESVAALILPALLFASAPDSPENLTYFGGTPTLSAAQTWPTAAPARLPDGAETLRDDIRAHIAADVPLAFIGQVDLAKAPPNDSLPREGRLLFFYDPLAGPLENGARFARVLHDTAPASEARPLPTPPALLAAEAAYIAETEKALANFEMPELDEDTRKLMRDAGMSDAEIEEIFNAPPPDLSDTPITAPFRAPRVAKELTVGAMLPSAQLHEFQSGAPALHRLYFGESDAAYAFQDAYDTLAFETTYSHMLATPLPEQDDPRYSAAVLHLLGRQFAGEAWTAGKESVFTEARNWELLLQISFADWLQSGDFEGTLYFLIRKDDLAARRFERAIAIFQQT